MKKRMKQILAMLMCTTMVFSQSIITLHAEEIETLSNTETETEVIIETSDGETPTITVDIPEPQESVNVSIPVTATVVSVDEPEVYNTSETVLETNNEEVLNLAESETNTTTTSTAITSDSKPEDIKDVINNLPMPDVTGSASSGIGYDPDTNTTVSSSTTVIEGSDDQSFYKETTVDTTTTIVGENETTIKSETTVDGEYSYTETEIDNDDPISVDFTGASITDKTIKTIGGETFTFEYSEYDESTNTTYYYTYEGTERKLVASIVSSETTVGDGKDIEYDNEIETGMKGLDVTYPEKDGLTFDKDGDNKYQEPTSTPPDSTYDYYFAGIAGDSVYGAGVWYTNGEYSSYDVCQFYLKNTETGESQVAYCVDLNTAARTGKWYTLENIDDADYYSASDAKRIKAIAANGYWGTESGTGSLSLLKEKIAEYYDTASNTPAFKELDMSKEDLMKALNAGHAQTATQICIWNYGNSNRGSVNQIKGTYDSFATDYTIIQFICAYLDSCELTEDQSKTTEVLTADNFITSVGLNVNDKVKDHTNNKDDDTTNDVYNVDLTFALAVTVTSNDDLIVKVIDNNGNVLKTCRLAGNNNETGYDVIAPDANGKYVIKGLELIEGNVEFNMVLQGAQYLEQGVYLYSAQGGYQTSQTFISMAEGYNVVDLSTSVSMNFNVTEGNYKATKSWESKKSTVELIPVETEPETETETTPPETEPATEPVTEPETKPIETEPVTEKVTESETENITEKETELITEPETETELVTEKETDKVTEKESESDNNGIMALSMSTSVKTGDDTNLLFYSMLIGLSAVVLLIGWFTRKK